jgi:hypothetical protein
MVPVETLPGALRAQQSPLNGKGLKSGNTGFMAKKDLSRLSQTCYRFAMKSIFHILLKLLNMFSYGQQPPNLLSTLEKVYSIDFRRAQ